MKRLMYKTQFLMLAMTEDQDVRVMKMDILCSVARPANLVMNNKVLFIFPFHGMKPHTDVSPFLLHDGIHAGVREVDRYLPLEQRWQLSLHYHRLKCLWSIHCSSYEEAETLLTP